jgi:hypothetical protein
MSSSSSAMVLGVIVFGIVITEVLTLDTRLCITGAAIGVIALVIHIVRAH